MQLNANGAEWSVHVGHIYPLRALISTSWFQHLMSFHCKYGLHIYKVIFKSSNPKKLPIILEKKNS